MVHDRQVVENNHRLLSCHQAHCSRPVALRHDQSLPAVAHARCCCVTMSCTVLLFTTQAYDGPSSGHDVR